MTDSALIVFLRKPELGKVKTRLAKDIGNEKALEVYKILIDKTFEECLNLDVDIYPFFSPEIPDLMPWNNSNSQIQKGSDLGECMSNAFKFVFKAGYKKVVIIGSDCYSINSGIIKEAFKSLDSKNFVIGPSEDGGYYLLGMKKYFPKLFQNIEWSKEDVFENTINKISGEPIHLLKTLNDIDNLSDLEKEPDLKNRVI